MAASLVPARAPDFPDQAPRFLPLETIGVRFHAPPDAERGPVFGIVSNISETGGCIITNRTLPVGAEARLSFETPRRETPLEVSVRIVWCAERLEPVKEIVGFLTGVCFDPEADGSLRDFIRSGLFQAIP